MNFAKIHNTTLIKYPYTFVNLREENPYSRYDGRFTLPKWYAQTNDAANTASEVVDVFIADQPEYDISTHYLIEKQTPELIDGLWTIKWDIVKRLAVVENNFSSGIGTPE